MYVHDDKNPSCNKVNQLYNVTFYTLHIIVTFNVLLSSFSVIEIQTSEE